MSTPVNFGIPIVFCTDGKFVPHALVTILSILKTNKQYTFQFYLIGNEFSPKQKSEILAKIESMGSNIDFVAIDDSLFDEFPVPHHFSIASYYRLLIPELLPLVSKVLYLDADIVAVGSLKEFLELPLQEYVLAAVTDPVYRWKDQLGMKEASMYFNSGVMLINLELWRNRGLTSQALKFVGDFPDKIRFVDQCALNAAIDGDFLELHPKFNQQATLFHPGYDFGLTTWTDKQIKEAIEHPLLIHYTGPSKPWQYNSNHPKKIEYWKVQKDSPLRLKYPEGMVWLDHIKSLFPNSLKQKIKSLLSFGR